LYVAASDPFDSAATIHIILYSRFEVALTITDEKGRPVFTFNKILEAGLTVVVWDITDYGKLRLPNGVYFCRLIVDGKEKTVEMHLQR